MAETAVAFMLESLNQLRKGETDCPLSVAEMNQISSLYEEVESLRSCLKDLEKSGIERKEVEDLLTQIRDVAADLIGMPFLNRADKFGHVHVLRSLKLLCDVLKEIKSTEEEVMEVCGKKLCAIGDPQQQEGIAQKQITGDSRMLKLKKIRRQQEMEGEMAETAVDSVLEKLNQLIKGEIDCPFSVTKMNLSWRSWAGEILQISYEAADILKEGQSQLQRKREMTDTALDFEVQNLLLQIRGKVYEAANIIKFASEDKASEAANIIKFASEDDALYPHFSDVLKEIKSIKKQVMNIYDKKLYGVVGYPQVGLSFHGSSSRTTSTAPDVEEEIVVGFDHEAEMLKERLTGMSKQLQVISIIGMAGLGKTTLARKLYNDPFILYHFYIRGWTYVSQVYRKRDLLLGILTSVFEHKSNISTECDEKLGEDLYHHLKGKRYLVVMDDMWHIGAWNDLKIYFPNDNNGSRILFTSRHTHVALHANHYGPPHHLPFLNEDHSWDLLQKKIFWKESCPPELTDIGKQIAKKCQGLPLAIVVVAGLLAKTDKNQDWWKQVGESLSSYIASDTEQCMDILALSYYSLPRHLRLCFLYFGAFPEDYEISVRKLIWLWIAEGFIHRIGHKNKSLEDVAEDYLMDLIDRNLVMVAKRRSTGGIRACRVHDLLHDLCLKKAKEENFLQQIYKNEIRACHWYDPRATSSSVGPSRKKYFRLCANSYIFNHIFSEPFAPYIRSFLCFVSEQTPLPPGSMPFIHPAFKLLRVLDLSAISFIWFPSEIVQLFLLRYLALQGKHLSIPTSIGNLQNLEMLVILQWEGSFIPNELWNIVTLRHLRIAGQKYVQTIHFANSFVLYNLQTISYIPPTRYYNGLLARTPNLRKLGFCGCFDLQVYGNFWFPDLEFLNHLETLKLLNRHVPDHHRYNLQSVKFPPNLKSLTLSNTALEWKEMSVLGMLPNLEVLKLEYQACIGSLWESTDGGFRRLKYLRLYYMNIEQWNASSIHFPSLQRLLLHRCRKLKEIPSELGDICTLQTIEVSCCSDSAINSAREIQKEQEGMGNDSLKIIIINPPSWELVTYS